MAGCCVRNYSKRGQRFVRQPPGSQRKPTFSSRLATRKGSPWNRPRLSTFVSAQEKSEVAVATKDQTADAMS